MNKFEKYWKLSEMEERYNASSGGIRTLTSAWILAALGAIGWLLNSYQPDNWPIPLGLFVVIVSLLVTVGITTLWVMDQLVFHRLLNSVFLIGLKMERDDPELPPIRSMMMKTQEGTGTSKWEFLFYLAPIVAFVIIAFGTDKLFLADKNLLECNARLISSIFFVFQLISLFWVILNIKRVKTYSKRASWFEDEEFTRIVSNAAYDSIIAKYKQAEEAASLES